ncbi:hypothetical protein MBLNU457_4371t2 [Dothideomycetes sp. NU457]
MASVKPMFADKKFFFAQRVPMRTTFMEIVQKYGGVKVNIEEQADYVIADHVRKDAPFGSVSYKFIEEAVRNGEIPDVEKYTKAQPGNVTRTAGIISTSGNKTTRTPFTAGDDLILWRLVPSSGKAEKGNEIYKEIAAEYPHHTLQSWRDRWIKTTRLQQPPADLAPASSLPSPPTDRVAPRATAAAAAVREEPVSIRVSNSPVVAHGVEEPIEDENIPAHGPLGNFTQEDLDLLLSEAEHIEKIRMKHWKKAWKRWAENYSQHTAKEWEEIYINHAQPEYRKLHPESESEAEEEDDKDEQEAGKTTEVMAQRVERGEALPAKQAIRAVEKVKQPERPDDVEHVEATPVKISKPVMKEAAQRTESPKRARDSSETDRPQFKRPRIALNNAGEDATTKRVANITRTDTSEADNLARMQLLSEDRRQRAELTRENLARMAASAKPQGKRAVDIQEDDEEEDQSHFISYLSGVLGPTAERMVDDKTAEDDQDLLEGDDQDLPDGDLQSMQDELLTQDRLQNGANEDLPDDSSQVDPGDVTLRPDHGDDGIPQDELDMSESQDSLPVARSRYDQHKSLFVQSSSPAPFPQSHSRDEPEGPGRVDLSIFEVAAPEGGWNDILSQPSTANALPSVEDVLARQAAKGKAPAFETQDVYNAQTQQVDFAMPEPDSLEDPDFDEQEPFETGLGEQEEDVEAWRTAQEEQGYSEKDVGDALYWSCDRTDLAEEALEYLDDNGAFPTVWSGFWSKKDDDAINGTDPIEIRCAEKLHGARGTELRRRFLAKES